MGAGQGDRGKKRAPKAAGLPARRSPSAEASLAAEIARVRALPALERMELALVLGRRRLELLALRAGGVDEP